MKKIIFLLIVLNIITFLNSTTIKFTDNWNSEGLSLINESDTELLIEFSVHEISLEEIEVNGHKMIKPILAGSLLPNNEGKPDLPGYGRYFAIPTNAKVELEILSIRKEVIKNIDIAPAPRIPLDTETGPLNYSRNMEVYSTSSFYPEAPVALSDITEIRGIDAAILGITPFQYNPVTKELIVYRDLQVEVEFVGGNGYFGADNLRSRWWDPILSDNILNYESLPTMDYTSNSRTRDGYEYLIICPDDATFLAWADSIKVFRTQQGISTVVMTTTEVGGNTVSAIENYIDDIMDPSTGWDPAPAAILLLGDYGTTGNTVVSPIYNNYCVSDN
ncbi:MAG: hypothetical protein KAS62_06935, partial [Candidatus Delongbacteria bacterium]|nr:hypothetical protein [Candidatus Delongbacteria bacterium]